VTDRVDSPPLPLFRESQLMAPWLMLPILVGLPAFFWYLGATLDRPVDLAMRAVVSFVTLLNLFLIAAFSRMATELTPAEIRVLFGWLPLFGEVVPLRHILGCEAVTYRPLAYGGWGPRGSWRGGGALNARGDRGVRLALDNGKSLIIGSQRPEALAEAIGRALQPDSGVPRTTV
jgi:hypothetical protein